MINTSLDSSNFYFLFAVLQGLVLAGFILFQKPSRRPHLFLGLLILLFSISLLHLVLEKSIHAFNSEFPIPMDFSLAYGPLAYLHVLSLKQPKRKFRLRDALHFLPTVLIDGILFSVIFLYIGSNLDWALNNVETIQQTALITALFGVAQMAVYAILIYRETQAKEATLREFSAIQKWLKTILFCWSGFLIFLIIALPIALWNIEKLDDNSFLIYSPVGVIMGLCIYVLGYLYLLRYRKLIGNYMDRVLKFKFSPAELDEKQQVLLYALKENKGYRDPALSLAQLAGELGWPINDLSTLINEGMNTNFNDLINQHRIKAFVSLSQEADNQKYSLLGLAEKVGFSSKASFYRVFKKETGMSPSAYLKSNELK